MNPYRPRSRRSRTPCPSHQPRSRIAEEQGRGKCGSPATRSRRRRAGRPPLRVSRNVRSARQKSSAVESQPDHEDRVTRPGCAAPGLPAREPAPRWPRGRAPMMKTTPAAEEPEKRAEQRSDGEARRNAAEREDRTADRKRRAAREGDHPVHADDHTGRRQAVQAEQCGHHGERAADEDRMTIALRERPQSSARLPPRWRRPRRRRQLAKWNQPPKRTFSRPTKCRSAAGTIAANAAAPRNGIVRFATPCVSAGRGGC